MVIGRRSFLAAGMAALAVPATASRAAAETWELASINPRPSASALADALADLAERSNGRVRVRTIGDSNEGSPVWAARVGSGPIRLQYITQQHGNEPLGTPAAVALLRTLGMDDGGWATVMRSRTTVEVIVRVNPDGHARNWRYNYAPGANPRYGRKGRGFDLNRYHSPSLDPANNPATESGYVQAAYRAFDPDVVVDYHMQGRYVDDDGREITASVMWPTNADVTDEVMTASQRASLVIRDAITNLVPGTRVSRYPGGTYEGIARNAYGLQGSASVLVELSNRGDAYEQQQILSAYVSMWELIRAAADGSLGRVNAGRANQLPPRGPHLAAVEQAYEFQLDSLD